MMDGARSMSCAHAIFAATARCIRKASNRRTRRFDRTRPTRRLHRRVKSYWLAGIDALFSYMAETGGWAALQQHVQLGLAASGKAVRKAMSDSDRRLLVELLAKFGYFDDAEKAAKEIVEATAIPTFEEAAAFALKRLGIAAPDFELRNERVRELLLARSEATIFSTRNYIDDALGTVVEHFYELGEHPYSQATIDNLKKALGYKADWEAKRFALTETGIACELAQVETYRRNGVQGKQWNVLGVNTRPTHAGLAGVIVGIDDQFDVGGYPADHPLDPKLPPEELCNCHCWLSPVVADDFQVDPANVWEGQ